MVVPSPLRYQCIATLGVIVCAVIITFAGVQGWADVQAAAARRVMQRWDAPGGAGDIHEQQRVLDFLTRARELDPANADHLLALAHLYEWRARSEFAASQAAARDAALAIGYARQAVQHRPASGAAWAQLADMKVLTGEFDTEVLRAMRNAMELAPWDKSVQKRMAAVTLQHAGHLPLELQAALDENLLRTARAQSSVVIALAVRFNAEERVRPLLESERDVQRLDKKVIQRNRATATSP